MIQYHFRIIYCHGDVPKNIESHLWSDIEELTVLAYAQVSEPVNCLVHQLLNLVILAGLHRCKYLKRKRYSGIVKFLRPYINRSGTLTYFNPILFETGVGQYVNISLFCSFH